MRLRYAALAGAIVLVLVYFVANLAGRGDNEHKVIPPVQHVGDDVPGYEDFVCPEYELDPRACQLKCADDKCRNAEAACHAHGCSLLRFDSCSPSCYPSKGKWVTLKRWAGAGPAPSVSSARSKPVCWPAAWTSLRSKVACTDYSKPQELELGLRELAGREGGRSIKEEAKIQDYFERIYRDGTWVHGNKSLPLSGSGSTLEKTASTRAFILATIKKHGIKSIIDAPCGDLVSGHSRPDRCHF